MNDRRMRQSIVHIALVVRDYDEAIRFYTEKLLFTAETSCVSRPTRRTWV